MHLIAVNGSILSFNEGGLKIQLHSKQDNKEAIWIDRLKQAQEYPGSVGQYCASNGFSYAKFKYWRNKLNDKGAITRKKIAKVSSPFVRVEQTQDRSAHEFLGAIELPGSTGARFVAEVLWHMTVMGRIAP